MEFDEYEYLEKAVENSQSPANGGGLLGSKEKERSGDSKRRSSAATVEAERDGERRSKHRRSEDRDGDERRGSSRHRSSLERGERERERERHRSKREHKEADRDEREREKEKDKERSRERDREKERERDREKEKDKDKDKDREKDRDRDREKERERDKDKERERSRRSRSKSEKHREEERDGDRAQERSRERDYRLREYERDHRRYRDKKEEAAEPEADPERDQRTVFAYQLSLKADERDVYDFFSRAGKVRDVRLIMDRNSRRSKGVGYIEFYDVMSVPMAIALSGQLLLGQPVMVKPSEAEKNLVQSTTSAGGAASGGARKLYVGNLHSNITEDQLRQVFEPFGQVELVQLPLDPLTGLCKGFGFIQANARAAQSLNGQLDIAGRIIKVSAVTDQAGVQASGTNTGDLDDDEGGGLALNASSRALLMQKLDRSGTTTSMTSGLVAPAANTAALPLPAASVLGAPPLANPFLPTTVPPIGGVPASGLLPVPSLSMPSVESAVPSECLLLKNMFDPSVETEPDFDLDIKDDVSEECSKFGTVKHIFVDKNSAGFVYLRFDSASSAMNAQRALHGRWFAGKMITASYLSPQYYEAKFLSGS
ncbi:RNA-binding protein 39 [Ananas comosus]|uniref:RNA-binding protein 39 n=1 Tax=Ananas comosus TaxID=4615 RepID=A0A199V9B8_ANACO|nr:RNA-binding protein 39 [Ananas comosus]